MAISVDIENFRSIVRTQIELEFGVNILIGSNGSGKTNIFSALKFLRDLLTQGAALALAKNGGPVRNYRRGQKVMRFSVKHDYGSRVYRRKRYNHYFCWDVSISQFGEEEIAKVVKESLSIYAKVDNEEVKVFEVSISREHGGKIQKVIHISDYQVIGADLFSYISVLSSGPKKKMYADFRKELVKNVDEIVENTDYPVLNVIAQYDRQLRETMGRISNLNEYNILPDVARQATDQVSFAEISSNGGGLSEVIHALEKENRSALMSRSYAQIYFPSSSSSEYNQAYRRGLWGYSYGRERGTKDLAEIFDRVNKELSLAVVLVDRVTTQVDQTNGKRFIVFLSGGNRFYPEEISDGTIKWLSIVTSIFINFYGTYLLEEPENFLHPWMQQRLINIMREQSKSNRTIFLITSHSATILNAAMTKEITVVARDNDGTHARRLEGREQVDNLLQETEFGLGDLWVSGFIGGTPGGEE